jgi:hypothetical protein
VDCWGVGLTCEFAGGGLGAISRARSAKLAKKGVKKRTMTVSVGLEAEQSQGFDARVESRRIGLSELGRASFYLAWLRSGG